VTEEQLLALERAAFLRLIKTECTLARIEHLLTTNKPLRSSAAVDSCDRRERTSGDQTSADI